MRILQDAIEEFLQDLPEQALAALIEKKLTAQGVKLSARQRKLLTRRLNHGSNPFRGAKLFLFSLCLPVVCYILPEVYPRSVRISRDSATTSR